ncbi:hypothetical protein AC1031_002593 [Aphanomyces cochlioides]|nr:hypothetical protein AC1031_002593 [Aphanomyces cochlioides]
MKLFTLSAIAILSTLAEGTADAPTAPSHESTQVSQEDIARPFRLDMTGFRDHRPSHPVYIYAPHFDLPIDMSDDDTSVVTFLPRRGQRKSIRLRYGRQSTEEEDAA